MLADGRDCRPDGFKRLANLVFGTDRKTEPGQVLETIGMAGEGDTGRSLDIEHEQGQFPFGNDGRVQLTQRAGGTVARIGKNLATAVLLARIDTHECIDGK